MLFVDGTDEGVGIGIGIWLGIGIGIGIVICIGIGICMGDGAVVMTVLDGCGGCAPVGYGASGVGCCGDWLLLAARLLNGTVPMVMGSLSSGSE